jgi:hypothetical protein
MQRQLIGLNSLHNLWLPMYKMQNQLKCTMLKY